MMRVEAPLAYDASVFLDEDIIYPYVFCEPGGGSDRYVLPFDVVKGNLFIKEKVVSGNVYISNRPTLDSDVKSGDATLDSAEYQKRQKQIYYESFYDVLPALFEGTGFVSSADEVGEVVLFKTRNLPKDFVSLIYRQSADRYRILAKYLGTTVEDGIRKVRNEQFILRCFSNANFGLEAGTEKRDVIFPIFDNSYVKKGRAEIEETSDDVEEIISSLYSRIGISGVTLLGLLGIDIPTFIRKSFVDAGSFVLELEYDFSSVEGRHGNYFIIIMRLVVHL